MHDKLSAAHVPNQVSPSEQHRRQMLRQVWLPLGVGILVALALMILTVVGAVQRSSQIERWGNISAVLVILPVLGSGVLLLAIVGGLAFGVSKLLGKMPHWMLSLQLFMLHVALSVRRVADSTTKPVIATNTFSARVSRLWKIIFGGR